MLAVPIAVEFRVNRLKETRGQVKIRWLFGLVRFRIGIPSNDKAEPQDEPPHKQKRTKKTKTRKSGGKTRGALALIKQSVFRRHIIRFIRDIFRATHARDLFLRLRIGLGDPGDTGRLWVLLGPVAGMAQNLRSAEVVIEPEFMDPVLEIESHGKFRFVPLQFIGLAIAFVMSPITWRAWHTLRRSTA